MGQRLGLRRCRSSSKSIDTTRSPTARLVQRRWVSLLHTQHHVTRGELGNAVPTQGSTVRAACQIFITGGSCTTWRAEPRATPAMSKSSHFKLGGSPRLSKALSRHVLGTAG